MSPRQSSRSDGGESGIRTRGTLLPTRFPVVPVRPLRHLSIGHLFHATGRAAWADRGASGNAPPQIVRVNVGENGIRTHGKGNPYSQRFSSSLSPICPRLSQSTSVHAASGKHLHKDASKFRQGVSGYQRTRQQGGVHPLSRGYGRDQSALF